MIVDIIIKVPTSKQCLFTFTLMTVALEYEQVINLKSRTKFFNYILNFVGQITEDIHETYHEYIFMNIRYLIKKERKDLDIVLKRK